jgi:regulatory protein
MSRPPCWNKALDLLARRSHFRRELEHKLAARGYPEDEVAETLQRLAERGWLDDRQTARRWLEDRLRRGPVGRRRLLAELGRKGVGDEVAAEALAEVLPDDDREAARESARAWTARRAGGGPRQAAALARHLERQGFSRRAILSVLEETGATTPDSEIF